MMRNRVWGWCCVGLAVVALFLRTGACLAGARRRRRMRPCLPMTRWERYCRARFCWRGWGCTTKPSSNVIDLLAQEPNQPTVKHLLDEIQDKKRQQGSFTDLRRKLDTTMIGELNVRDASVTNVIEILRAESEGFGGQDGD